MISLAGIFCGHVSQESVIWDYGWCFWLGDAENDAVKKGRKMAEVKYKCDYTKLILSFNEFHNAEADDMPQYGEFCLLELKDGRYTAGKWNPNDYKKNSLSGEFIRGTADTVEIGEISKWHSLQRYDLADCLADKKIRQINLGSEGEEIHSAVFRGFRSLKDGDFPKSEQYCLLILKDGQLSAGRWDEWTKGKNGTFVYAPALACHSMNEVWAWTPLSSDEFFEAEEEGEKERKREEELNRNPSVDEELFKYGTDIEVYYEKALERLKKEYPWATVTQMKKVTPYAIAPCHGKLVFGQVSKSYYGTDTVTPWTGGSGVASIRKQPCKTPIRQKSSSTAPISQCIWPKHTIRSKRIIAGLIKKCWRVHGVLR